VDTRSKILSPAALANSSTAVSAVAWGYFDPLLAAHARELAALRERSGGPVVAVVLPLENALLPLRARAEMVAALRMIDYVVIADDEPPESLIACLHPAETLRLEEADRRRTCELREHARSRHGR
jgi:bifunctional ADP-heptose synthase (sugar kinase/adenylyltransferase)